MAQRYTCFEVQEVTSGPESVREQWNDGWEWTVPATAAAKFSVATVFPTTGTDEFEEWLGSLVYANEEFRERAKHVVVFRTK